MNTIPVQDAYQDEMALSDDPILSFQNPEFDHECIVIDLVANTMPGTYGARCCVCGQTTLLAASAPLTLTPNVSVGSSREKGK